MGATLGRRNRSRCRHQALSRGREAGLSAGKWTFGEPPVSSCVEAFTVLGERHQAGSCAELVDTIGILERERLGPVLPMPKLRAVALAAGLLQHYAVREMRDIALAHLTGASGLFEQPQALALEVRIVAGVLRDQPRGVRTVRSDERPAGPTPVPDDLLQPFDVVTLCCLHLPVQVPVGRRPRLHLLPRRLIRIAATEELAAQLEISTSWWRRCEVARAVHDLFELEPSLFNHPKLGQDPRSDAVGLGEQAEEDVFCAQEGMPTIAPPWLPR